MNPPPIPGGPLALAVRGLVVVSASLALICLGIFLLADGWRAAEVRRLTIAAGQLRGSNDDPATLGTAIELLEKAARVDPRDARLRFDAGERHVVLFELLKTRLQEQEATLNAMQAAPLLNPGCTPAAGSTGIWSFLAAEVRHQERRRSAVSRLEARHVGPALSHFLAARNSGPTRAKTHLEIATYVGFLKSADARRTYLDRALLLDPMNPDLWYRAGLVEYTHGQTEQGCKDWRRSLEMSDALLKKILTRASARMDLQQLVELVLPEQPRILIASANVLYPDVRAPQRRIFFEKADKLFRQLPGPWEVADMRLKGLVFASLGRPEEALAAYQEALMHKPEQADWRFEFAQLLFEQERFQQSRQELQAILSIHPRHYHARQLLNRVEHALATGKS